MVYGSKIASGFVKFDNLIVFDGGKAKDDLEKLIKNKNDAIIKQQLILDILQNLYVTRSDVGSDDIKEFLQTFNLQFQLYKDTTTFNKFISSATIFLKNNKISK